MRSYHTEILTSFTLAAIKFKVNEKVVAHSDWKLIGYHMLTNELFKNSLYKSIYGGNIYSEFDKAHSRSRYQYHNNQQP